MTVGEKIRWIRKKKQLTQKELGEKCGINQANIRKYESGRQSPKLDTLQRIADGLQVPVEVLIPSDYEFMQNVAGIQAEIDRVQRIHDVNSQLLDDPENQTLDNFRTFNASFREDLLAQNVLFSEMHYQESLTHPGKVSKEVYVGKTQVITGLCGMMNVEGLDKVISYLTDLTQIPEYII